MIRVDKMLAIAAALAIGTTSAAAQTAPKPVTAPVDPARLSAARQVVARLMPPGTYKRMMDQSMGPLMDSMTQSMGQLPVQELARLSGITAEEASTLGTGTIEQVMAIYDPHWRDRLKRSTDAMMGGMTEIMTNMEPAMREGLSRAYAREFVPAELAEMDRFFATPAGAHYALKSLQLFMDPEMMKIMSDMVPEMTKRMPDMMAKAEAAVAALPKPRSNSDLTPAERAKLATLLGVPADTLKTDPEPAAEAEDAED
ncbi:DUF2059 domain-containing protein [Sphingomonas xinjiangensis]|uniref:DUF2059 domain-containing protein n=1 Tax=Sphingomonas xinjiangensis TaxID=643568 RepID=A0A840YRC8_9SPHN|nr:DUF2059 domain-containing protein [Sphingomonas xinjiangensis]MBB5712022.1 hypothetical protein [Sphingomonas xinjiangensis]